MKTFNKENEKLRNQFSDIQWIEQSGISEDELKNGCNNLIENPDNLPISIVKAKIFEFILKNSRLAIVQDDIFQEKIFEGHYSGGILNTYRWSLEHKVRERDLKELSESVRIANDAGAYSANSDFGHTSPNSKLLLEIGFTGILERIKNYSARENLTASQKDFYSSCEITLEAILFFIKRLAKETEKYDKDCSVALENIAKGKPNNIYEAMQLLIIYFFLHEYVGGTRVRTLGRLDVLLTPFYKNDLENGTFSKAQIKEMIKFFFNKFWSAKVPFDLPICLGGIDENGEDVTNELTYLLVETYDELDIHSPKIHIRVSNKTPLDFIKLVLKCIRGGNSSFVFVNDNVVIKGLENVGIAEQDAKNYVPIGCYEPAVWGKEIGCTGNGGVNLAKAVEFTFTGGVDFATGQQISVKTDKIVTYDDFINAIKTHISYMTETALNAIREIEKRYGEIGPDPLLSSMYEKSLERGVDVFEGGAEYNNTSYYYYFIATLVDSVCAVKKLVFDDKLITFDELSQLLKSNWQGNEKLRQIAMNVPEKYGNGTPLADALTKEFTDFCASLVNNKPNSRGGVFKAACFSIDSFVRYGAKTMATPDGRMTGEILSKNLCASVGMDKKGITGLINSVSKIDHTKFPNGTVLDIVLHPSAVSGEDGLNAFYSLVKTYFSLGGLAIHGNVFNHEVLKEAQKNPEKYKNLQVRVCGWNAYFVNLSKTEQDCFIKQAEQTF